MIRICFYNDDDYDDENVKSEEAEKTTESKKNKFPAISQKIAFSYT